MQLELQQNIHDDGPLATFVEVIIPLAVEGSFTYRLPKDLESATEIGKRCTVQFGRRHIYTGIIIAKHHKAPKQFQAKYVIDLLDDEPSVGVEQLKFWKWISDYYMCSLGEVMDAALPNQLKLKSETHIILNPERTNSELNAQEALIVEALEHEKEMSISDVAELLNIKNALPYIRALHYKGQILSIEELKGQYRPKTISIIKLSSEYSDDETLTAIFEVLEADKRSHKQADLLTHFLANSGAKREINKSALLQDFEGSQSSLNSLLKKEIFQEFKIPIDRWQLQKVDVSEASLNEWQKEAIRKMENMLYGGDRKPILLHGVTGSGKTHIYIELLKNLQEGEQALYLVPEIGLTTQLIARLNKTFGNDIAIYHSKLSHSERFEMYQNIKKGKYKLLLGARSSIFLPFNNLQLIIVDEEHDPSFKQQDPAPRYNGRDCAIYLAHSKQIPLILGTATPSLESYYHAQQKKYHYLRLAKRHGDIQLPLIEFVDLKNEASKSQKSSQVSSALHTELARCLSNGYQSIIFQNRRGYSPILECKRCGWVPFCKNCDISLTYHKYNHSLSCHYCGFRNSVPEKCPQCNSQELYMKGIGTERLEDEIQNIFPKAMVSRMDLDTTRNKHGFQEIIELMENGQTDILVGTQMVTKGLDFEKVKLVGVVAADSLMYYPDFRAQERAFQILNQVAGRAGRKGERGKVIIQTYQPDAQVYQLLQGGKYKPFYQSELQQRAQFAYPPFIRMINLTVKHKDQQVVNKAAQFLFEQIEPKLGRKRLTGPEYGSAPRLKNRYNKHLLIKLPNKAQSLQQFKKIIKQAIDHTKSNRGFSSVTITVDVDPY